MTFYTSLSGLQASQTDMSVISHNLANVSTTGFKKSRTDFADVIASSVTTSPTSMVGSGVVVKGNVQQFGQGSTMNTASALDLMISGDGFFAVKTAGNNGAIDYTRNGAFAVDKNRYIVDAQGSFLQAYPVDAAGTVTGTGSDSLTAIQLPETSGTPVATRNVALSVNLSASANGPASTFSRTDPSSYNNSTTTTVYDAAGNAQTLTNYYVRDAGTTDANGKVTPANTWTVHSFVGDTELTSGGATAIPIAFDATGALTSLTAAVTFDAFTPAGSATQQTLALNLSGSTQLTSPFSVASRSQDGATVGKLQGVTVDDAGVISASFSNGDTKALGKVALANFANPSGLRQLGDSYWASTGISGSPTLGAAGDSGFGSLNSSMLEGSNVDITEELVALIAAQRNFQANSKALDTENQISQTIFNIRS